MEKNVINIEQKQIERTLSKISSKIADATELFGKAKESTANAELLLIAAQQEIENLYASLDHRKD